MAFFSRLPKGLGVILYADICELFGRFGVTALLVLFLKQNLGFSDQHAFVLYGGFVALFSAMPVVMSYVSKHWLSHRQAILLGSSLMTLGNALLIFSTLSMAYLGLAVIALGFGLFYPSITTLLSRLYDEKEHGRDTGFTLYYIAKNIGALSAPLLCGFIGQAYGYSYTFILSTLGMASGVYIFWRFGAAISEKKPWLRKSCIYTLCLSAFLLILLFFALELNLTVVLILASAALLIPALLRRSKVEYQRLLIIGLVLLFAIIFSGCLGQGGTTLNFFILRLVDRHLWGTLIPPTAFYALDPLFMIFAGPLLGMLWMWLGRCQREPHSLVKCVVGLFALGVGFWVFVIAAHQAALAGTASAWYVVLGYCVFPFAELLFMPIALSFITAQAPRDLTGLIAGAWMLTQSVGGYLTGKLSLLGQVDFSLKTSVHQHKASLIYAHDFAYTSGILILSAVILLLLVPLVRRWIARL